MPRITEQNKLALVIAYYLSKFDEVAYSRLGFGRPTQTHKSLGQILDVKQTTIKNMRDEFDPLHDNPRQGWYQRPITGSRLETVKRYSSYSESALFERVQAILYPVKNSSEILFNNVDMEEIVADDQKLIEGELVEKKVLLYKRNQKAAKSCKERDSYTCQGCGFYYQDSIVECHHIKPLSMIKESHVDAGNLITLCPTCHRIAHVLLKSDYDLYSEKNALVKQLIEIKR